MSTSDIQTRRRSFLIALAGFSIFSLGDGITKSTAGLWPALAVASLRFLIAAAMLGAILMIREGPKAFAVPRPWLQLGRGLAMAASTGFIFMAFQIMPLATATAIAFVAPLLTALLSAIFLRERVPLRVWLTIFIAFVGVLLVLQPNFARLGERIFLPLAAALGTAFLMVLNRRAAEYTPPLLSQFLVALPAAVLLAIAAFVFHLTGDPAYHVGIPSWSLVARVAILAMGATIGHSLIYIATMRTSAAIIAPASYVQIMFAVTIGWIAFGDMPDVMTCVGITMIVGAGLWLLKKPES